MSAGNSFNFIGRLTADPELKQAGEAKVCNFTLAANIYRGADRESQAVFPDFQCWNRTAENLVQYAKKGQQIAVTARYDENYWTDSNNKKKKNIFFIVEGFTFLGRNSNSSNNDNNDNISEEEPDVNPVIDSEASEDDCPF